MYPLIFAVFYTACLAYFSLMTLSHLKLVTSAVIKATTWNFHFVLILADPVDKSG